MNPEQIREAAPDLYDACKFVLDPNRSGYALFSHRATIILEASGREGRRQKSSSNPKVNLPPAILAKLVIAASAQIAPAHCLQILPQFYDLCARDHAANVCPG